jgi:Na+/melibiose symporter-like transporter
MTPKPARTHMPVRQLFFYGFIGLPLAMGGLPIFVHIPPLFTGYYGISMGSIAAAMIAIRILDAVADPFIGHFSDRYGSSLPRQRLLICIGAVLLALGLWGFALPWPKEYAVYCFAAVLAVCALSYSLTMINALALGASLSKGYQEQNRISAWREGFSLIGVLIASSLPVTLAAKGDHLGTMGWFAIFCCIGTVVAIFLLRRLPADHYIVRPEPPAGSSWRAMFAPLRERAMRWMLAVALSNAIASCLPATLVIYYIQDVVQSYDKVGLFLFSYFLSGALGMPLWLGLSRRIGKKRSWMCSMVLAGICFTFAALLGPGDDLFFLAVCIASGAALGADLVFGPSMMGDVIHGMQKQQQPGLVFGLWNLVNKSALTLAAAIALPLLALAGYTPAEASPPDAIRALAYAYALLPFLFKAIALLLLWVSPLDKGFRA